MASRQQIGVHPLGGGDAVDRIGGGRCIRPDEEAYGCALHSDVTNPGPMRGSRADDGDTGIKKVDRTRGVGPVFGAVVVGAGGGTDVADMAAGEVGQG